MLRLVAIFFAISFVHVDGQIPKPCANDGNLARECCPTLFLPDQTSAGPCGEDLDRGKCDILNLPFVENEDDERKNWPIQLFERVCNCSGNYDGYDCGECKFGYTGEDCNTPKPRQMRQSLDTLTSESWSTYLEGLRMAKTTKSRYWVLTQDSTLVNPTIYDLFIWIHHFSAKDNPILNRGS